MPPPIGKEKLCANCAQNNITIRHRKKQRYQDKEASKQKRQLSDPTKDSKINIQLSESQEILTQFSQSEKADRRLTETLDVTRKPQHSPTIVTRDSSIILDTPELTSKGIPNSVINKDALNSDETVDSDNSLQILDVNKGSHRQSARVRNRIRSVSRSASKITSIRTIPVTPTVSDASTSTTELEQFPEKLCANCAQNNITIGHHKKQRYQDKEAGKQKSQLSDPTKDSKTNIQLSESQEILTQLSQSEKADMRLTETLDVTRKPQHSPTIVTRDSSIILDTPELTSKGIPNSVINKDALNSDETVDSDNSLQILDVNKDSHRQSARVRNRIRNKRLIEKQTEQVKAKRVRSSLLQNMDVYDFSDNYPNSCNLRLGYKSLRKKQIPLKHSNEKINDTEQSHLTNDLKDKLLDDERMREAPAHSDLYVDQYIHDSDNVLPHANCSPRALKRPYRALQMECDHHDNKAEDQLLYSSDDTLPSLIIEYEKKNNDFELEVKKLDEFLIKYIRQHNLLFNMKGGVTINPSPDELQVKCTPNKTQSNTNDPIKQETHIFSEELHSEDDIISTGINSIINISSSEDSSEPLFSVIDISDTSVLDTDPETEKSFDTVGSSPIRAHGYPCEDLPPTIYYLERTVSPRMWEDDE